MVVLTVEEVVHSCYTCKPRLLFASIIHTETIMGSITTDDDVYGSFRYSLPSEKTPAYDRSLYSFPASEVVKDHQHKLHDIRTSTCIEKGGAGLDVQGFTHVKHESKLSGDEWFSGKNVEDVYAPEVIKLICEVTGANRAVVDGFAVRSRAATETENDPYDVKLRGNPMDLQVSKIPRNIIRGKNCRALRVE